MGPSHKEKVIDQPTKSSANERPDPVHPVVGPHPAGQGRPKWPCGVHGRAGEGPASEDVGSNDKTDEQRAEGPHPVLGIDNGAVDGEEEGEGEDYLHDNTLERAHPSCKCVHGCVL